MSLVGIFPTEIKYYVYTNTCTQTFIAVLFVIAQTRISANVHPQKNVQAHNSIYTNWNTSK